MIYVTGDVHGNQYRWKREIEPRLTDGDIIIVCGDFGIGFWSKSYGCSEEEFFDYISEKSYTLLFIDGNHENFTKLYSYPVEEWRGGKIHKIRHNLIHLMRGEVYNVEGRTIFTFGGGYSLDRKSRVENVTWWRQEMPTEEEYQNGLKNLERVNFEVDIIITHTAPSDSIYYLSTISAFHVNKIEMNEMPLNSFFNNIQGKVSYKNWFFGHFHCDRKIWKGQTALYNEVKEISEGHCTD